MNKGPAEALTNIPGTQMATATEAGNHIFISPSRFRDLIGVGTITRMAAGRYSLDKVREEYCKNAQKVMQGRAADSGATLSAQRARLATAQAEGAELRNAVSRGDFIALKLVETSLAALFSTIRENVLTLPGKAADALTPHTPQDRLAIYGILRSECRDLLTGLSSPEVVSQARATEAAATDDADTADGREIT